jgi:hypothetical protein
MKKLISLVLIFSLNIQAGTTAIQGEQASKVYAQDLVVPNLQATKQAGLNTRIETGNTNILSNPSFENATVASSWTATNATTSADTTNQIEGKKALSLSLTGILSLSQTSTINVANTIGLQGMASIYVKTSVTDVSVCSVINSAEDKCVAVTGNNTWVQVQIPFIFGATNNGIKVKTTSSTSGTVLVDNAFVGLSSPFTSGANIGPWIPYTPTLGAGFGTPTSVSVFYRQVGDTIEVQGSMVTGTVAASFATISLPNSYTIDTTKISLNTATGSSGQKVGDWQQAVSGNFNAIIVNTVTSTSQVYISPVTTNTGSTQLSAGTANSSTLTSSSTSVFHFIVPVTQLSGSAKLFSQASQDYGWTAYTPVTTGFGTITPATNACSHRRSGGELEVRCSFTEGTATATYGTIKLPSSLSIDSTRLPTGANLATAQGSQVGDFSVGGTNVNGRMLTAAGTDATLVYISGNFNGAATTAPQTSVLGGVGSSLAVNIYFKVPIQGWQDYGVIVGSFAGIEKCDTTTAECYDTFSAQVGTTTGTVTNTNYPNWITCTAANPTVCTFAAGLFTVAPNCTATILTTNTSLGYSVQFTTPPTSTSATMWTYVTSTGVANGNNGVTLSCQRQGVDTKPKTAKIATSIGVPTVPGITTTGVGNSVDTFSAIVGTTNATTVCSASPCSYVGQVGSAISSVTRTSTGLYVINTSKTYTKLICSANGTGGAAVGFVSTTNCATGTCTQATFDARNTSATAQDIVLSLYCQGTY